MVIFQITPKLVTDIRKEFQLHSLAKKVVLAEFFNFNLIFRLAWVGWVKMHKSSSRGTSVDNFDLWFEFEDYFCEILHAQLKNINATFFELLKQKNFIIVQ